MQIVTENFKLNLNNWKREIKSSGWRVNSSAVSKEHLSGHIYLQNVSWLKSNENYLKLYIENFILLRDIITCTENSRLNGKIKCLVEN